MKRTAAGQAAATARWKLLKNALLGADTKQSCQSDVSVRRFTTFNLIQTTPIQSANDDDKGSWYDYLLNDIKLRIRHCETSREDMKTFNNTGNVCVWPAEEILSYYCLKEMEKFKDLNICELGGGMTCLAGLFLAKTSSPKHILVTDGNDKSVDNVKSIIKANQLGHIVKSQVLRWDKEYPDLDGKFHMIISADCLFFDEFRESLVRIIDKLLTKDGQAWIMAPTRWKTLSHFVHLAGDRFLVEVRYHYDDRVSGLHRNLVLKGKDVYDPNLHYPVMIKLSRKLAEL